MILRVPVTAANIVEWVRLAANAINQLIVGQEKLTPQDTPFPGPFADDAAASAGGVNVGSTYRKPDGSIWWRVS